MTTATPSIQLGCLNLDSTQTVTYVRWAATTGQLEGDCCGTLDACGCWADSAGDVWIDPVTDGACWIPATGMPPEGALDFLGFQPITVDLGGDPFARGITERASGDGGVIGAGRRQSRTIRVTGLLWATSSCGMAFAERWLTSALNAGCAGVHGSGQCGGETLSVRVCCPEVGGDPETGLRVLHDVALAGITIRPMFENDPCCMTVREVEITLIAANPWLYECSSRPPCFDLAAIDIPERCNIAFTHAEPVNGVCGGCATIGLTACSPTDPRCVNGVMV